MQDPAVAEEYRAYMQRVPARLVPFLWWEFEEENYLGRLRFCISYIHVTHENEPCIFRILLLIAPLHQFAGIKSIDGGGVWIDVVSSFEVLI